ncbi:MAG: polyphosphate kinase 2 family protein [Acidobacteriaceae bacterium]|jgi:PPK2 family polyphosphate:nucleotide phosphotransferase|nr:polyphosphate kinase 2 family protein [Acidobacteriaceae bacterium]
MIDPKRMAKFKLKPGKKVRLKEHDTAWRPEGKEAEAVTQEAMARNLELLNEAQGKLYAGDEWSILVVLQAMDAAGKDGLVKHVMSGLNPQGCHVHAFKAPSAEELDHSFLWRCMRVAPARGTITIFNRSHYEEVLVVKVHPELLGKQKLPPQLIHKDIWEERYEDINNFELHLARNGTRIIKIFLHVSKDEQKRRFLERLDKPAKNWKFSLGDLEERKLWDKYQAAYEEMLAATTTKHAPWYVIPADHKFVARAAVAEILTNTILDLAVDYPSVSKETKQAFAAARERLLHE